MGAVACDLQGTVWVGTYSGGINYFNPQKQIYREYQASPKEKEGLSSPIVKRMTEDNERQPVDMHRKGRTQQI